MELDIREGRRKPFPIRYVVVTEQNIKDVALWSNGVVGGSGRAVFIRLLDKAAINTQQTKAFVGDVIVEAGELEKKTYKKFTRKAFNKTFEKIQTQVIHKDATDGKFVSPEEAEANPAGTFSEVVELPRDAGLG
jgi:hypothetical protein